MSYERHTPKTVFITGATGDFGKAFTRRFAAMGSRLILHGRNADKLAAMSADLDTPCHTVLFDLSDRAQTLEQISSIPNEFKDIDLLINNAGGALGNDKAYISELEDWERMIESNNTALARITHAVLPGMVERRAGHIINIGSTAGSYPYPGGNVYCAVKAFTKQFSLALRADLCGTNVRVTNVEPGMAETQFSLARFKGDAEKAKAVYANTAPLTAEDVAESVSWAATLPTHMNINRLQIMPTVQSFAGLSVDRQGGS